MIVTHYVNFAEMILKSCNCDSDTAIFSTLPSIDFFMKETERNLYTHGISIAPSLLNSAKDVFSSTNTKITKSLPEYIAMKKNKIEFLNSVSKQSLNPLGFSSISNDEISEILSILTHIYLDSFFIPIHGFLPNASLCCGQWSLWDNIDYLKLRYYSQDRNFLRNICLSMNKSVVWNIKLKADDFPLIVRRRLMRENLLDKPLDSAAMIKAIVIRLGELCRPNISYEVLDYSIREIFTYLKFNRYLRSDRELLFLSLFEEDFKLILQKEVSRFD